MDTPGKRIIKWREYLKQKPREFAATTGIPYTTLKTIESDSNKPSYDVLVKLRNACPQLNIDWIFDEGDSELMLKEDRKLTPAPPPTTEREPATSAADATQSNELAEPQAVVPTLAPTVRRKTRRPIMTADPDLSHMTPEQQAKYWKGRHDLLANEQAQEYETEMHQEALRLVNFRSASSNAAGLYALADSLAIDYPSAEVRERLQSISKFRPKARVIPMYTAPGFKVGEKKQA